MEKSPDAFRTISEVADLLETPAHVLRFWESRFPQIRPVKRAGGRRYYRPSDVALLTGIRRLLHDDGLTIRGVQKILREQGVRHVSDLSDDRDQMLDTDLIDGAADDQQTAPEPTSGRGPIPLFPHLSAAYSADDAAVPYAADVPLGPTVTGQDASEVDSLVISAEGDGDQPDLNVEATTMVVDDLGVVDDFGVAVDGGAAAPTDTANADSANTDSVSAPIAPEVLPAGSAADGPVAADDPALATPPPQTQVSLPDVSAAPETANSAPDQNSPAPQPADVPDPPRRPAPAELPEITGHWLAADLRGLHSNALAADRARILPLVTRLQTLRDRVADRGRIPRR